MNTLQHNYTLEKMKFPF